MFDHMDMATVAVVIAMCPADIYGSTEAILGHFYLYHPNYNHHIFSAGIRYEGFVTHNISSYPIHFKL